MSKPKDRHNDKHNGKTVRQEEFNPDAALTKFELEVKATLYAASQGKPDVAAAGAATAMALAMDLNRWIQKGGRLPKKWQPKYDPAHIWVDAEPMLNCCLENLLNSKDDPDVNKDGNHIKCETCHSYVVMVSGVWQWRLPPRQPDVAGYIPLTLLEAELGARRPPRSESEPDEQEGSTHLG